ncbi:CocE/NonD family hydrolase [Erwiniaceae bacterium BAC15a-03b]|uniref:CocE/NonD family hydrolase n=1 Tax=Winslowiella arboricola TaxID=2978220 RepID=A0A9J6PXW3_9GAMM|nr:CocE/NonD family hydrolase [Winslowiella arboricola]MCU5775466.1 CocE/NonD family hydrolase [Winslowiella arboricola]MCU5779684.1 CocE/NonD family hydrolase [Winslowiella arboricola]
MKQIISDFPHAVTVTEHLWITLRDGTRLAVRMWLPDSASSTPVPAILEYIPYRKRDGTRTRDEPMHGYFSGHGYAVLRVDMRGSGESDGLLADEYLLQEQEDALEVIDWISRQHWCNGAVGMMGKSWGGFNCLQLAARRPAALKAIITVCSTDDRYNDDIHYKGGCLLNDNLWWGGIMLAYQSRPQDPQLTGGQWREEWQARLDNMPFFPALWMEHPLRDAYWQQGSVCEDWSAIQCPVLAIGGWADAYSNAVFRLMDNLQVPSRAIIGPWAHIYPQDGTPEPAIGFLQEGVSWWDHWLKGADNDAMAGPRVQAWLNDSQPPSSQRPTVRGEWVGFNSGSADNVADRRWYLDRGQLNRVANPDASWYSVCSPQNHGLMGGEWMGAGVLGESPPDQRIDDGQAEIFDGEPLAEPLAFFGFPQFEVLLKSDKPAAMLYVRLSDVSPDGAVNRVTHGWVNLAHLQGQDKNVPLTPGVAVKVKVQLDGIAWRFAAGHRMRVSVATTFWPMIWPMAEQATLTLDLASASLTLPVCANPQAIAGPDPQPATAANTPLTLLSPGRVERSLHYDVLSDSWTSVTEGIGGVFGEGVYLFDDIDTTVDHSLRRQLSVSNQDPLSAHYLLTQTMKIGREGWWTEADIVLEMRSDLTHFIVSGTMKVTFNGEAVADKVWNQRIAR